LKERGDGEKAVFALREMMGHLEHGLPGIYVFLSI
jgi:hypothetical protein